MRLVQEDENSPYAIRMAGEGDIPGEDAEVF
jgi:hypothetical protein